MQSKHNNTMNKMRKVLLAGLFLLAPMMAVANPVDDLLNRMDAGAARKFITELQPSDTDFFELSQRGGKVCVKGNTWVNIATGVNWYLKHHAGIMVSWNNMHPRLPERLPAVKGKERRTTWLTDRYDFNYCTFSYSMAFWDWNRWQEEIDWMALHGINMPLAVTGEEVVWRNMLLKLGYSKEEIGRFIAGPAFLAWWAMNNLEGWGGPLPDNWYRQQEYLQKRILQRERSLGMQPVLPGYCGMLPHDAKTKMGVGVTDGGQWNGYTRPANLIATDPSFDRIADLYYKELTRLYGKASYYSMDPFHESADNSAIDYAACGRKLLAAMKRVNPAGPGTHAPRWPTVCPLETCWCWTFSLSAARCLARLRYGDVTRATVITRGCSVCWRTSEPTLGCTGAWTNSSITSGWQPIRALLCKVPDSICVAGATPWRDRKTIL